MELIKAGTSVGQDVFVDRTEVIGVSPTITGASMIWLGKNGDKVIIDVQEPVAEVMQNLAWHVMGTNDRV